MTILRPITRMGAGRTAVSRRKTRVRIVAAAAMWCMTAMAAMAAAFIALPSRRGGLVHRDRHEWEPFIRPFVKDGTFKARFRMDPDEFNELYEMLRTRLECDERMGRGGNGTIAGEWALASTLQWLAGHGVSAGADGPRMAKSTTYAKIKLGLDAINDCGRLRIKWPRTRRELRAKARGFCQSTSQLDPVLKKCVGALYGVLVRRVKPTSDEHPCPDRFFSGHKMNVGMNNQVRDVHFCLLRASNVLAGSVFFFLV